MEHLYHQSITTVTVSAHLPCEVDAYFRYTVEGTTQESPAGTIWTELVLQSGFNPSPLSVQHSSLTLNMSSNIYWVVVIGCISLG